MQFHCEMEWKWSGISLNESEEECDSSIRQDCENARLPPLHTNIFRVMPGLLFELLEGNSSLPLKQPVSFSESGRPCASWSTINGAVVCM